MSNRYIYLTLLAVLGWNAETAAQNGARQVPRLVVNITIDQLRSDYLEAYAPLYSANGFKGFWNRERSMRMLPTPCRKQTVHRRFQR